MPNEYWRKVIFYDECKIECFNSPAFSRVRRKSSDNPFQTKYMRPSVRYDQSLMIWGFFCQGNREFRIFWKTIDSVKYLDVLENKLLPSVGLLGHKRNEFIFQDDSAPIHRAKKVQEWKQLNRIDSLPWVGNSPDLNLIENLWKLLKLRIAKYKVSHGSRSA